MLYRKLETYKEILSPTDISLVNAYLKQLTTAREMNKLRTQNIDNLRRINIKLLEKDKYIGRCVRDVTVTRYYKDGILLHGLLDLYPELLSKYYSFIAREVDIEMNTDYLTPHDLYIRYKTLKENKEVIEAYLRKRFSETILEKLYINNIIIFLFIYLLIVNMLKQQE